MLETETICSPNGSDSGSGPPSLQNEFENLGTGAERTPEEESPVVTKQKSAGTTTTKKEQRSANTLYQELSFQDNEESEENEVTGEEEEKQEIGTRWLWFESLPVCYLRLNSL